MRTRRTRRTTGERKERPHRTRRIRRSLDAAGAGKGLPAALLGVGVREHRRVLRVPRVAVALRRRDAGRRTVRHGTGIKEQGSRNSKPERQRPKQEWPEQQWPEQQWPEQQWPEQRRLGKQRA